MQRRVVHKELHSPPYAHIPTPGETLPSLSDHSARWFHQSLQRASFGDAMRRMSKAGPVALQSWLSSPDVRDLGVTEIVEQSLVHSPPSAD